MESALRLDHAADEIGIDLVTRAGPADDLVQSLLRQSFLALRIYRCIMLNVHGNCVRRWCGVPLVMIDLVGRNLKVSVLGGAQVEPRHGAEDFLALVPD